MFVAWTCALCLSITCSKKKKVFLWSTRCLIWAIATHMLSAMTRWQSLHCWLLTTYSTTNTCCKIVPWNTSCCTVNLTCPNNQWRQVENNIQATLRRLEWGSVQTKFASTSLTLVNPFVRLMQKVKSWGDSRAATSQALGGCNHLQELSETFVPLLTPTCHIFGRKKRVSVWVFLRLCLFVSVHSWRTC